MIWSVISGNGIGHLYVVQGMMKQGKYKQMFMNRLLPEVRDWFRNGESFIFMKDGPPCYTVCSVKSFLHEQNKPLLFWLGNLPDMNLIKNVYGAGEERNGKGMITATPLLTLLMDPACSPC